MNSSARSAAVMVVGDEVGNDANLGLSLENVGYRVSRTANGEDALAALAGARPDIILIDTDTPDMDGPALLKQMREQSGAPIFIISKRDEEAEKIEALDGGANDYITKPFSMGELLARLRVAQRYLQIEKLDVCLCGPLKVDFTSRIVTVKDQKVRLTPTEYSLLHLLAKQAGKVLTYQQMLRKIWGPDQIDKIRCLRVYLRSLRSKLEPDPSRPALLITEPGIGIRLAM
jgi:two-component system KDP operon response regulator KdpE